MEATKLHHKSEIIRREHRHLKKKKKTYEIVRGMKTIKTAAEPSYKISLLENTGTICLVNKRSYWISISIDSSSHKMQPVHWKFDTGAEWNLIREEVLETDWLRAIQAVNGSSLNGATNQEVGIVGTCLLHVRRCPHPTGIRSCKESGCTHLTANILRWQIFQGIFYTRAQDYALQLHAGTDIHHSN